jgi:glycolate oxidase FAD binding subunit
MAEHLQAGSTDHDAAAELAAAVSETVAARRPLRLIGRDTKAFYGRHVEGQVLDCARHTGVVNYEPTELVLTARAGTPLRDIERLLADNGQALAFEPPAFGDTATLGGTIACGFSGPRRPYAGAARDFVLGARIVNGRGEVLSFGGQVMKNVAGYDLSRLMVGALGGLGVLLDISLKVLPRPLCEHTVMFPLTQHEAIARMNEWAGRPLPVSATCCTDDRLYVRLSGSENGVRAALRDLGGEVVSDASEFWRTLREHQHPFFQHAGPLWRVSVAQATPPLALPGDCLIEWGGGLRWLKSDAAAAVIRAAAAAAGGHATLFRGGDRGGEVFHPLSPALFALHRNLKRALDPEGIFNPGRMYDGV